MADIRTAPQIDDFDRANESPVQLPWRRDWENPPDRVDMRIGGTNLQSTSSNPNNHGVAIYTQLNLFNDMEIWGLSAGNANLHDSYQLGVLTEGDNPNGYQVFMPNNVGPDEWQLHRVSGGNISLIGLSAEVPLPAGGDLVLFRTIGSTIEVWFSTDAVNWTLNISASDSTYRTNLFPYLGARGGGPAWDAVGAIDDEEMPQIYRRPNE